MDTFWKKVYYLPNIVDYALWDEFALNVDNKTTKIGIKFKVGDKITICVDEAKCTVSFSVNNSQVQEVAKVNKSDSPYFLAVSMGCYGDKLRLLTYLKKQSKTFEETKETESEVLYFSFLSHWYGEYIFCVSFVVNFAARSDIKSKDSVFGTVGERTASSE